MNHLTIHTHRQPPQRNPSKNTIPALPGFRTRFTFHASRFTRVPPARAGAHKPLHLSRTLYKSTLFMQNKPNFLNTRINISSFLTMHYENHRLCTCPKNKPNQPQSQPPRPTPSKTTTAQPFRARFALHAPAPANISSARAPVFSPAILPSCAGKKWVDNPRGGC